MVLDPIPQSLPVHFFGSRPQPPTSRQDLFHTYNVHTVTQWPVHTYEYKYVSRFIRAAVKSCHTRMKIICVIRLLYECHTRNVHRREYAAVNSCHAYNVHTICVCTCVYEEYTCGYKVLPHLYEHYMGDMSFV